MKRAQSGRRARVGAFAVDLESGEVVGADTRVRLQVQSLELLKALLERPGSLVTREELRQRLWPDDTFVDFDHGLNAAIRRLRESLADSADEPRYIETIPRKGYRLIAETATGDTAADAEPTGEAIADATSQALAAPPPDHTAATPGAVARIRSGRPERWRLSVGALAIVVTIASGLAAWSATRAGPPAPRPPMAIFDLHLPADCFMNRLHAPAVSPDSRYLAFTACGALWVRALSGTTARRLPINATAYSAPFWSPDSTSIGFVANRQLRTISVEGEREQVLADAPPFEVGGAWLPNGDVLFTPMVGRAVQRLASTGVAQSATSFDVGGGRDHSHLWPYLIPGSDLFTFVARPGAPLDYRGRIGRLDSTRVIDLGPTHSRVIPVTSGHLLWVRDGILVAQALDRRRVTLIGRPTAIAHDVAVRVPILGQFSASADLIVYLSRDDAMAWTRMTVFDRTGTIVGTIGPAAEFSGPRVSPDGTRVAVGQRDPRTGTRDIWVYDLTGKPPLRLTLDPRDDTSPVWSTDGRTLLFTSDRDGTRNLYTRDAAAQRPEVRVFASDVSKSVNAWSPDGRIVIYDTGERGSVDARGRATQSDLEMVTLDGASRTQPVAATAADEVMADISPDGRLVAYQAAEAGGRGEVYVETFPAKGGRWQVSVAGGFEPIWRADGRELFFRDPEGRIVAIDVHRDTSSTIRFGAPHVLFTPSPRPHWSVRIHAPFPDGQRFLLVTEAPRPAPQKLTAIVNWRSALPPDDHPPD